MRQSMLFSKTFKSAPKGEVSVNAELLLRAGFIDKLSAGVYTYLPLGLRVLDKIKAIVRGEMNKLGGQEILMPALTPKDNWVKTGRWENPGAEVMFQIKGRSDKEFALGWTHEEIVTPLVKKFVQSYRDLPVAVYQIQDKFRNEPRPKSGLLRGLEFSMKDLYSFHADAQDLEKFYEKAKIAYSNVFSCCGLDAKLVEASGGAFSEFSHEYQVITENGEDVILYCEKCGFAQNSEICKVKAGGKCPKCGAKIMEAKAIEVGNIFPLGAKFSNAFVFEFVDKNGKNQPVVMGCYGIGPSRVMGAVVEVHHDEKGIAWPENIAPYFIHLLTLGKEDKIAKAADKIYEDLRNAGVEVLYDDRDESAGVKFAESDLIGLPWRAVVSEKTLKAGKVEVKRRTEKAARLVEAAKLIQELNN